MCRLCPGPGERAGPSRGSIPASRADESVAVGAEGRGALREPSQCALRVGSQVRGRAATSWAPPGTEPQHLQGGGGGFCVAGEGRGRGAAGHDYFILVPRLLPSGSCFDITFYFKSVL